MASQHAAAILANPKLRLAAVCSRSRASAEKLAAEWVGAAKDGVPIVIYDRYEDLLGDARVDIVSECMPNFLHAREAPSLSRRENISSSKSPPESPGRNSNFCATRPADPDARAS